jgi:hypothetical protein
MNAACPHLSCADVSTATVGQLEKRQVQFRPCIDIHKVKSEATLSTTPRTACPTTLDPFQILNRNTDGIPGHDWLIIVEACTFFDLLCTAQNSIASVGVSWLDQGPRAIVFQF